MKTTLSEQDFKRLHFASFAGFRDPSGSAQLMTFNPLIFVNSFALFVTSVALMQEAWAALSAIGIDVQIPDLGIVIPAHADQKCILLHEVLLSVFPLLPS